MPDTPADMTDEDEQTARRDAFRNNTVPDNHGVLGCLDFDTVHWLRNERDAVDAVQAAATIIQMEQVRQRNPWKTAKLTIWASQGSRARIDLLRLLVERSPHVALSDVYDRLDVSERRARDFVKELRDADIIETPGRPAQVRFVDDDVELIASDVAAYL